MVVGGGIPSWYTLPTVLSTIQSWNPVSTRLFCHQAWPQQRRVELPEVGEVRQPRPGS